MRCVAARDTTPRPRGPVHRRKLVPLQVLHRRPEDLQALKLARPIRPLMNVTNIGATRASHHLRQAHRSVRRCLLKHAAHEEKPLAGRLLDAPNDAPKDRISQTRPGEVVKRTQTRADGEAPALGEVNGDLIVGDWLLAFDAARCCCKIVGLLTTTFSVGVVIETTCKAVSVEV